MPAIKSSSRTGSQLVLYGNERKAIENARKACDWIAEHAPLIGLSQLAGDASDALGGVLSAIDGQPDAKPKKDTAPKIAEAG